MNFWQAGSAPWVLTSPAEVFGFLFVLFVLQFTDLTYVPDVGFFFLFFRFSFYILIYFYRIVEFWNWK